MDLIHKALKALDHNRYTALAIAAGLALLTVVGCVPGLSRVPSPFDPEGPPVSLRELDIQAERFQAEMQAEQAEDERATQAHVDALIADFNARTGIRNATALAWGAEVEARVVQLQERQAFVEDVAAKVGAALGLVNPAAGTIFGSIASIVLGGVFLDNRRKNSVIKDLKQAKA